MIHNVLVYKPLWGRPTQQPAEAQPAEALLVSSIYRAFDRDRSKQWRYARYEQAWSNTSC